MIVLLAFTTSACSSAAPPRQIVDEPVAQDTAVIISNTSGFTLTSPDVLDGRLPVEYTCDGTSSTLALTWSGVPAGTQSFAIIMHHVAPDNAIHWYWVVYDIPADVTSLAKNIMGIGTLGTNSVNDRNEYAPPCWTRSKILRLPARNYMLFMPDHKE